MLSTHGRFDAVAALSPEVSMRRLIAAAALTLVFASPVRAQFTTRAAAPEPTVNVLLVTGLVVIVGITLRRRRRR
jgi:hypothetical protein